MLAAEKAVRDGTGQRLQYWAGNREAGALG